jgi:hypothetical protein
MDALVTLSVFVGLFVLLWDVLGNVLNSGDNIARTVLVAVVMFALLVVAGGVVPVLVGGLS